MIGNFLTLDPVAMTISSASSLDISLTSVFKCTDIGSFAICVQYHLIKSLSFSLNSGAAAAINTPPNLSVFHINQLYDPSLRKV